MSQPGIKKAPLSTLSTPLFRVAQIRSQPSLGKFLRNQKRLFYEGEEELMGDSSRSIFLARSGLGMNGVNRRHSEHTEG